MQKATFLFVLFALVAVTLAHHGGRHDGPPMPNPPPTPPTQEIEDDGKHRVAREMPTMDEMKQYAQEQISKLPEPIQEEIRKAQEMIAQKIKEHSP